MAQDSIKCPKCGAIIPLSEALSHDIEERARHNYEGQLAENKKQLETVLKQKETEYESKLAREKKVLAQKEQELEERSKKERAAIEVKLKKQAEESVKVELSDLKGQVEESKQKLKQSQDNELILRKKQRELEEKEKSLELELVKRVNEECRRVEELAFKRFQEEHSLKDAEKDKKLADALKQAEEFKRKLEQGSQQTQGEVLELELEELFKREFPFDVIEAVSKGVRGGDILQTVKTQSGRSCGKILWETKRAKNWSDSWLQKLKDDQREAKANLAVLVSETLPSGFHHFRQLNDVWVTDIPSALSLALALRVVLIQVATAKEIESSKDDTKDLMFRYITGPEFRNRVSAIIEGFRSLKEDLDTEKRAMQRIWEKREKQIERIISNTAGMYGDLEGLAGSSLPQIKILELPSAEEEKPLDK
jgi:hypothetical protein